MIQLESVTEPLVEAVDGAAFGYLHRLEAADGAAKAHRTAHSRHIVEAVDGAAKAHRAAHSLHFVEAVESTFARPPYAERAFLHT